MDQWIGNIDATIWIPVGVVVVVLILRAISVKKVGGPSGYRAESGKSFTPVPTPPGLKNGEAVRELIARGRLINAIKIVREELGLGLKEAKDYVDALREGRTPEVPPSIKPAAVVGGSTDAEVQALVREGKIIEAVKLVREKTGLGLKEAKDYVDRLRNF